MMLFVGQCRKSILRNKHTGHSELQGECIPSTFPENSLAMKAVRGSLSAEYATKSLVTTTRASGS